MNKLVLAALMLAAGSANADTITQWNFNSVPADTSVATGTVAPNIGSGLISLLNGVTSPSFNSGVGSSDVSLAANSSTTAININLYANATCYIH